MKGIGHIQKWLRQNCQQRICPTLRKAKPNEISVGKHALIIPNDLNAVLLFFIFICFSIAGCCTRGTNGTASELINYKKSHPDDYKHFVYLLPTKLDTYQYLLADRLQVARHISTQMKIKFTNSPGVQEFADREFKEQMEACEKASQHYTELEKLAFPDGTVCQFCWNDGKTQETGMLVLKSGNIIERDVWITDFVTEKPK
jgi:hypothetical protein